MLRELMAQEGYAMAMAECTQPALEPDDLAYTVRSSHLIWKREISPLSWPVCLAMRPPAFWAIPCKV
jgi:hypothetical protein